MLILKSKVEKRNERGKERTCSSKTLRLYSVLEKYRGEKKEKEKEIFG